MRRARSVMSGVMAGVTAVMVVMVSSVFVGAPVEAGFEADEINVVVDGLEAFQPSLAFNPERREYLAVYKVNPTKLMAVRLDADGEALGGAVEIAPQAIDPFRSPDVVYNPQTDQYLVAWNEFDPLGNLGSSRGAGRLVSDLGVPAGPAQVLHQHVSNPECRVQGVDVDVNPSTGGYTVVFVQWSSNTTGCDGGAREAQDEQTMIQPLGSLLEIGTKREVRSGQAVTNVSPYLAVDPATGQHVVGVHDRDGGRHASYLYTSDLAAGPIAAFAIPAVPGNDRYNQTDIALDADSGLWTVVASRFGNVTYLQTFDASGTVTVAPVQISDGDFSVSGLESLGDGTFVISTILQGLVQVTPAGAVLGSAEVFTVGGVAPRIAIAVDPSGDEPRVVAVGNDTTSGPAALRSRVVDVTPGGGNSAIPLPPGRILETREGPGLVTVDGLFEGDGMPGANRFLALDVAGRGGVPSDASAVFLNIAATGASTAGFVTAYPCDSDRPETSNLNHPARGAASAAAIARLDRDGRVCLYTSSDAHLIVDVGGYVPGSGDVGSLVPARLLETRGGLRTIDGAQAGIGRVAPNSVTPVDVTGRGGVPADADAVLINVTAIRPSAQTFLTVYPCDEAKPTAANLNAPFAGVVNNLVLAKVDGSGNVCVFSSAETDLVIDVSAFVPAGGGLASVVPGRVLETRGGAGAVTVDGAQQGTGPLAANQIVPIQITGRAGVDEGATGVTLNVAAIRPASAGFVTVFPCDAQRPTAANLNFAAGAIVSNAAFVKLSADGRVCVFSNATTELAVDVVGFA